MELKEDYHLAKETLQFPVRYDKKGQTIWDANNMMVCDIRGWGKIQFLRVPEKRQDEIGELIADLLNDFLIGKGKALEELFI
jgi:hypothetical protein